MNSLLMCSDLKRSFGHEEVLRGIDLILPQKGLIGISGPSGSGKSTLLHILAGLDASYSGRYVFKGMDMGKKDEAERSRIRLLSMGYVLQKDSLLDLEDAETNVLLPALSVAKNSKKLRHQASSLLFSVGLKNKAKQKVGTLSGGERQRVGLARALMMDPDILFCDEPTGALDEKNGRLIFELLRKISSNRLVIVASHDEALLEEFADERIEMKDGKIKKKEKQIVSEPAGTFLLAKPQKEREEPRLPSSFLYEHAKRRRKTKKIRSFLSESAISLGLLGIGMSVYLSSSISCQITDAFSSLVPPNTLVMSPLSSSPPLGEIKPATHDEADYLMSQYPDSVDGYGKTLLYDFESAFEDENEFTYVHGSKVEVLSGFSVRTINDFLWSEEGNEFYPSRPKTMDWSEVILGIPYATMAKLCGDFGLVRGYEHLGRFCDQGSLTITLHLSRLAWNFSESPGFNVVAVAPSSIPCFYHASSSWNQEVFFDYLRFEDVGNGIPSTPQQCQTIPYLELSVPFSSFLRTCRKDPKRNRLSFDVPSNRYLPSYCPGGERCSLPRAYCFEAIKSGLDYSLAESIQGDWSSEILGRIPVTSGGFYADAESVMMGFQGKFFLCKTEEGANQLIDAYSDLPVEEASSSGKLPPNCVDGSLLATGPKQLRLSCDFSEVKGEAPTSGQECILSSSLYEAWNDPEVIYVCAEISSEVLGDTYSRDFALSPLRVVGTKQEKTNTLFVSSDWTLDYFLDSLGMSPFLLEPSGCVFTLKPNADGPRLAKQLSTLYPAYRFACPSQSVSDSVSSTTDYIQSVLFAFSFVAFSVGLSVFILVISLTVAENKKEARLLYLLGISRKDVARLYGWSGFQSAGSALLGSCLGLLAAELFTSYFLSRFFGTDLVISLSLAPYLSCFALFLLFLGFLSVFLRFYFSRANFEKSSKA